MSYLKRPFPNLMRVIRFWKTQYNIFIDILKSGRCFCHQIFSSGWMLFLNGVLQVASEKVTQARFQGGWRKFPFPNPKFFRKNLQFRKKNVWQEATIYSALKVLYFDTPIKLKEKCL